MLAPKRRARLRRDRRADPARCRVALRRMPDDGQPSAPASRLRIASRTIVATRQAAIALVGAFDDASTAPVARLVRVIIASAASMKRPYIFQFCHCSLVTRQRVKRILLEPLQPRSSASPCSRCIQNFRISAPSSVSVALEVDDLDRAARRTRPGRSRRRTRSIERTRVPGAQEESDAALRRQVAPEAPLLRTLALFVPTVGRRRASAASADPSTR